MSFTSIFAAAGFDIPPHLVQEAAAATGGYPFLIQLVGYVLWREAENNNGTVTAAEADRAVQAAHGATPAPSSRPATQPRRQRTSISCAPWPGMTVPPSPETSENA